MITGPRRIKDTGCSLFCAAVSVVSMVDQMIQIDLITGFLGSGKTTFLHGYAGYLMDRGLKIGIIENDFGAVNVDMMLLQDLEGEQCEREMVAGGADLDTYRRRFRTKLISMGMRGFDRVLIEPSGIFDAEEFFDALCEEPLNCWYEIGSVIAVVDAGLPRELSRESEYLLVSQLADAGCVVLSRTQLCERETAARTVDYLNEVMERFACGRRFSLEAGKEGAEPVIAADWASFSPEDYRRMETSGYQLADHIRVPVGKDEGFQSLYYLQRPFTSDEISKAVRMLFEDRSCGSIFRIKGFDREKEQWLEINAVRDGGTEMKAVREGQQVVIVIGEKLNREKINRYMGQEAV